MPTYCYLRPDNTIVEVVLPRIPAQVPSEIVCEDGQKAVRCYSAEGFKTTGVGLVVGRWPRISAGAGCEADQIPSMMAEFPHHEYVQTGERAGDMIFRNPAHMERCLKDVGLHPVGEGIPISRRRAKRRDSDAPRRDSRSPRARTA